MSSFQPAEPAVASLPRVRFRTVICHLDYYLRVVSVDSAGVTLCGRRPHTAAAGATPAANQSPTLHLRQQRYRENVTVAPISKGRRSTGTSTWCKQYLPLRRQRFYSCECFEVQTMTENKKNVRVKESYGNVYSY